MPHSYPEPRLVSERVFAVAEGPRWDPIRQRVNLVDLLDGVVVIGRLENGGLVTEEEIQFPDVATAVAHSTSGVMVVAGERAIYTREHGEIVARIWLPGMDRRRTNDGGTDPAGRFLVGTLGDSEDIPDFLFRVETDGSVTTIDDDISCSNGVGWSVDGRILYHVSSRDRRIYVRRYDDDGCGSTPGPRTVFVQVPDGDSDEPWFPDGLCLDAEDHVWLAVWGAGVVHRYSPDGELVGVVRVPARQVTSVAFVGSDLSTLLITTASHGLSGEQLASQPLAGRVFAVEPGVSGLAPTCWSGIDDPAAV